MDAFLTSVPLIAVAEIGDKTQLLSICLAARYRKPWPIIAGIAVATVITHLVSAWLGEQMGGAITSKWFATAIAVSFIVLGFWALIPDKSDGIDPRALRYGPFMASLIAFFFAEIGDKTQLATMALASRFHSVFEVMAGSSMGLLIANVPLILLGEQLMTRIPFKYMRWTAAAAFLLFGGWQLMTLYS